MLLARVNKAPFLTILTSENLINELCIYFNYYTSLNKLKKELTFIINFYSAYLLNFRTFDRRKLQIFLSQQTFLFTNF